MITFLQEFSKVCSIWKNSYYAWYVLFKGIYSLFRYRFVVCLISLSFQEMFLVFWKLWEKKLRVEYIVFYCPTERKKKRPIDVECMEIKCFPFVDWSIWKNIWVGILIIKKNHEKTIYFFQDQNKHTTRDLCRLPRFVFSSLCVIVLYAIRH